jgi:hypothetical protein
MTKSYVTLIQKTCVICGKEYDTNELAIDNHLRDRFERHTNMGLGVCPEHVREGYVALVGIDPDKSDGNGAWKTGEVTYLKRHVFNKLFKGMPLHKSEEYKFADQAVIHQLQELAERIKHAA